MRTELKAAFTAYGLPLGDEQADALAAYHEHLLVVDAEMNLTAIHDNAQATLLHYLDSASVLRQPGLAQNAHLADVGSGAGFPGLVLAVLRPDLKVTLMDALQKRVRFLEDLAGRLSLSNVRVVQTRAEDAGRNKFFREKFDIVTARAVAALPVLCEYCLPLVKKGGVMIAYKGARAAEEVAQAEQAVRLLGGSAPQLIEAALPGRSHHLIQIGKITQTPARFPRKAGTPTRQPL
ncbi:MAG: 16S rRNA (guanine(527)-N(7))-methyltransferase RsmG [Clostridia bacterium]|nr:16S rRNA (guanine(527)-N(7))-methyltransferase RsmG [Clostridia bacterium]